MLPCPVIYPGDTVVVYPFNRTLLDTSDPKKLRSEIARFLNVASMNALVTCKIGCAIGRENGLQVASPAPPSGMYMMWARPSRSSDADDDERFAVNDMACDMIGYGNRAAPDWAELVIKAREGQPNYVSTRVVTGPAILFRFDARAKCHVHVDVNSLVLSAAKMGNTLPWAAAEKEEPSPPLRDESENQQQQQQQLEKTPSAEELYQLEKKQSVEELLLLEKKRPVDEMEKNVSQLPPLIEPEPVDDPSPSLAVSTEAAPVLCDESLAAATHPSPQKRAKKEDPAPYPTRSRAGRQIKPNSRYAK